MKKGIMLLVGLLLILITILIISCSYNPTGEAIKGIEEQEINEFTVNAFRFGYSPDIIQVNKGDKVRIKINNTDTLHGIRIPDFGIQGNDFVEFTADKSGEFEWYCNNVCGQGHMQMKGRIIVS